MKLVEMSLSSVVIIISIIFVRSLFLNKLSKRLFVILWAIVLCRLFLPVSFQFDLQPYIRDNDIITGNGLSLVQFVEKAVDNADAISETAMGSDTYSAGIPVSEVIFWVWCVGMIVTFIVFLVPHARFILKSRSAILLNNEMINSWVVDYHFRRNIIIKQSDLVAMPVTYGVIKPIVLLPKAITELDEEQLKCVIIHELAHIRHFDVIIKWLLLIAIGIHWFNPFIWIVYVLANRDIELSCDEAVIRSMKAGISRKAYAMALINLAEYRLKFAPIVSGFNKSDIEERIAAIMTMKKVTVRRWIGTSIIIIGTGVLFATTYVRANSSVDVPIQSKELNVMNYPVNENGQTYGSAPYGSGLSQDVEPDLLAAYGVNGLLGYVKSVDLRGPVFNSPQEAIAYQETHKGGRVIPLYEVDGVTIIDEFIVGGTGN